MNVLHWIYSPLDLNKIKKWKPNRLSILFSAGYDSRRVAIDGTFQVSSAGSAAVSARRRRPLASRFSLHSKNGRPTTTRRNAQEKQSSFSDELQCDYQHRTLRDLSKVTFKKKINEIFYRCCSASFLLVRISLCNRIKYPREDILKKLFSPIGLAHLVFLHNWLIIYQFKRSASARQSVRGQ